MKKQTLLIMVAAAVLGLVAGLLVWNGTLFERTPPPELQSHLLPQPKVLAPFALVDQQGQPFDAARLTGKWTLVFFGYTHCPDVCPTTLLSMANTAKVLEQTPDGLDDTQFLFVSVDPGRDSPDQLKGFLSYFRPDFLGASGERVEIDNLVRQFGALYMFEGDTGSDNYIVNHSATIFVTDPQGRYVARIQPPHEAAQVAQTLTRIRHFYR